MSNLLKTFRPAFFIFVFMTVFCGIIYTGIITGVAQIIFPNESNGNILTATLKDGTQKEFGSEWISQNFTEPKYLIGRPAGTSNLSPVSSEQKKLVQERIEWWKSFDQYNKSDIPMDLVTSSGSGVDPNISPAAADFQVSRIAKTRGISEDKVRKIIDKYTAGRFLNFIGEPGVNVLKVNLALDGLLKR